MVLVYLTPGATEKSTGSWVETDSTGIQPVDFHGKKELASFFRLVELKEESNDCQTAGGIQQAGRPEYLDAQWISMGKKELASDFLGWLS